MIGVRCGPNSNFISSFCLFLPLGMGLNLAQLRVQLQDVHQHKVNQPPFDLKYRMESIIGHSPLKKYPNLTM